MDIIRRFWSVFIQLSFVLLLAVPASAYIKANPNPVLFSGGMQTGGMTTIQWDAGTASKKPYAVYYTMNDAGETLFAEGKQGIQAATFIDLGGKYEFCLWGNDKAKKIECVKVTTQGTAGGGDTTGGSGSDFIQSLKVSASFTNVNFVFKTKNDSLPVVTVSAEKPLPFDEVSTNDQPVFTSFERAGFAKPGKSHESTLDVPPGGLHYYVISAHDGAKGMYYRVQGSFSTYSPIKFDVPAVTPGANTCDLGFYYDGPGTSSAPPLVQASEKAPQNFEEFGTTDPRLLFNPSDVAAAALVTNTAGTLQQAHLMGLKPDTHYFFVISGWQRESGSSTTYWSHFQGEFRTQKITRSVTVTFDELVNEVGSSDMSFNFCVNGKPLPEADFGPVSMEDNERLKLNWYGRTFTTTLTDSPDKLLIQVYGFQSSGSWSCGTMAPKCDQFNDGSSSCGEWSTAQSRFDITGNSPFNFVVLAQPSKKSGSEVKFGVSGTIDVQYSQPDH